MNFFKLTLFITFLTIQPVLSFAQAIIDSRMNLEQAMENINPACPESIKSRQALVDVQYYAFDGKLHQGQIIVDERLKEDIVKVFQLALDIGFPFQSVIPISDERFNWSDDASMAANNTSGFNYREVTGGKKLSNHALGFAIDINPIQNPYIRGDVTLPKNAIYIPNEPGTLTTDHPIVKLFLELGWSWGGHWQSLKDYQHFEKVLEDGLK